MKKIGIILSLCSFSLTLSSEEKEMHFRTVIKEEGIAVVELTGVGYAFAEDKYRSFMIKVVSKVEELEVIKGKEVTLPIKQKVLVAPSAIRLGYVTYPIEVKEFGANYLKADVFQPKVTKLGHITKAEKIGSISLTFTELEGLRGGKGSLELHVDEKPIKYDIYFYDPEKIYKGFYTWAPELKK